MKRSGSCSDHSSFLFMGDGSGSKCLYFSGCNQKVLFFSTEKIQPGSTGFDQNQLDGTQEGSLMTSSLKKKGHLQ